MKVNISASVESALVDKLQQIAEERKISRSAAIQWALTEWTRMGGGFAMTCVVCGAEYSSKLESCPSCEARANAQEQLVTKETQLNTCRKRLEKLKEWLAKGSTTAALSIEKVEGQIAELEAQPGGDARA